MIYRTGVPGAPLWERLPPRLTLQRVWPGSYSLRPSPLPPSSCVSRPGTEQALRQGLGRGWMVGQTHSSCLYACFHPPPASPHASSTCSVGPQTLEGIRVPWGTCKNSSNNNIASWVQLWRSIKKAGRRQDSVTPAGAGGMPRVSDMFCSSISGLVTWMCPISNTSS